VDLGDLGDSSNVDLLNVEVEEADVQAEPDTMESGAQAHYLPHRDFSSEEMADLLLGIGPGRPPSRYCRSSVDRIL